MSTHPYDKILATKEYALSLVDQYLEIEPWDTLMNNIGGYYMTPDDLKDILNERYIENYFEFRERTCIVIGNSGSVIDNKRGTEIDDFDIVVRNNLARYEGFEKYVGNRTDIRFLSHKTFGNFLDKKEFSSYDKDYIPTSKKHHLMIRSVGNVGSVVPGFLFNIYGGDNVFSVLDLNYNYYLDRLASEQHFCTVGFSSVLTMLDLGCEVSVYGMDFYDPAKKFHYFEENSERVLNSHNHSIKQEKDYINNLIEIGKIKVL